MLFNQYLLINERIVFQPGQFYREQRSLKKVKLRKKEMAERQESNTKKKERKKSQFTNMMQNLDPPFLNANYSIKKCETMII